jgi:hypothetical protein
MCFVSLEAFSQFRMSKVPNKAPLSIHYCFTINNYDDELVDHLKGLTKEKDGVTCLIFGREIAPSTGTPHLQGFVRFAVKKRPSTARKILKGGHFLVAFGTYEDNLAYCTKQDKEPYIYGSVKSVQGERNNIKSCLSAIKGGCLDEDDLTNRFPTVAAHCRGFLLRQIARHKPKPEVAQHVLRDWQVDLKKMLDAEPCPRTIIFIVDEVGNAGKSWFFSVLCKGSQLH